MTAGYYTVVNFPYEGASITEHKTKADALRIYNNHLPNYKSGYLLGVALIHIDIVDEIGDWYEKLGAGD